jgi:predicted ester cyclase
MASAKEGMTSAKDLYRRWIDELWAGRPVANELVSDDFVGHWPNHEVHGPDELHAMVDKTRMTITDLRFVIEVKPFVEGDMLAARWIGTGAMPDGPKRFTGNDVFKFANGRFVEYWTGTSEG